MKTFSTPKDIKQYLLRQDVVDPLAQQVISYSSPSDMCGDIPAGKLGNQAGGFPFKALGRTWPSSEHLYLLGYWSDQYRNAESRASQEDVLSAKSGYAAKRFKKSKHIKQARPDFKEWRHEWMLWVVWQKCIGNADFRELLLATGDAMIVEVEKNDPVWAAWYDENGKLVGANGMGKILMICREALQTGIDPLFDIHKLCDADIRILDSRLLPRHFYNHRKSMCDSIEQLQTYCKPPRWYEKGIIEDVTETIGTIPFFVSDNMDDYLFEKCYDMIAGDEDGMFYELNDAMLNDLQYIAEHSGMEYDWQTLREFVSANKKSLFWIVYAYE